MIKVLRVFFLAMVLGMAQACHCVEKIAPQVHPLARNGIPLFLEEYSAPHHRDVARSILLVHGLTYSSHEFNVQYGDYSLTRRLVAEGYSVWLLDISGYGRSGRVSDGLEVDSEYAAADIRCAVEYIRQVNHTDMVDLMGWSWGTITAARMAAMEPSWIRKLVLYAPIVRPLGGDAPTTSYHQNDWEHASADFQRTLGGEISDTIVDPSVAAIFLSNCWRYDGNGSPNGGRRELTGKDQGRLIPVSQLTMPVLFIGGTKDPYLNWQAITIDFESLGNRRASSMVRIDGASHIMMLERPYHNQFQNDILAFLRK
jgi:pimeloyl-ACP methyl ester carboxylesterase